MSDGRWRRRTFLVTGACLGLAGCLDIPRRGEHVNLPGIQHFSTLTVPSNLERLVLIDGQRARHSDVVARGTKALLEAVPFQDLSGTIHSTFDPMARDGLDLSQIGKLAFISGTASDHSGLIGGGARGAGVVIWAPWDIEDFLAELNTEPDPFRIYRGQHLHRIDGGVAVHIAEGVPGVFDTSALAIGDEDIVRDVIDAWQGRSQLIDDDFLKGFTTIPERAPLQALIHQPHRDCPTPDAVDAASLAYISAYVTDDSSGGITLWVDPNERTVNVLEQLEGTLFGNAAGGEQPPAENLDDLSEDIEMDSDERGVHIEYQPESKSVNIGLFLDGVLCTIDSASK